jgi:hypothetical protein
MHAVVKFHHEHLVIGRGVYQKLLNVRSVIIHWSMLISVLYKLEGLLAH